jgi:hypothetical protein
MYLPLYENISLQSQITFNTQGSSQWDSFRHFAYQADKKFYNGYVHFLVIKMRLIPLVAALLKMRSTHLAALLSMDYRPGAPAVLPGGACWSTTPRTHVDTA